MQNLPLHVVAKVNVGESDVTPGRAQRLRARQVFDLRHLFQQGKHVLHID